MVILSQIMSVNTNNQTEICKVNILESDLKSMMLKPLNNEEENDSLHPQCQANDENQRYSESKFSTLDYLYHNDNVRWCSQASTENLTHQNHTESEKSKNQGLSPKELHAIQTVVLACAIFLASQ
ncbi:hypothetical protein PoB_006072000 [Plakobranchus ocellatus]|uniref:Uncharacterized protein n=1 Tax=Plakobranchus ocellatus TaxID=259542 RepID=A0AAV4CQN2_9GAST|nr:hypothetical protein PoB_006072000 [Plakobranchus ocellatus]